ncbi:hypothetical protein [Klebsiella aerogenes]|uniref:hypothetical protein n=1 Tax=Klebsiella aerogenes TaxID=548 RepID=UPI001F29DB7A|nr:hypothetical protein [Klebsiella aerogenes]
MKLGFFAGAILATWLSLTYPSEMTAVFDKLTFVVQQIFQSSGQADKTGMVTPDN